MACWVGYFHSSHHPAKFVEPMPSEREDIFDLLRDQKCHTTLCVGSLILSHHLAKFGVHRLYEKEI